MKRLILFVLGLVVTLNTVAAPIVEGKDYQLLVSGVSSVPKGQVEITEYFSYGCPWCYQLEPKIQAFQSSLPSQVVFNRVPVVFEKGWDIYAKAYYTVNALKMDKKLSPLIFKAIQEENNSLDTVPAMSAFLVKHGVQQKVANSAFDASPSIETKMKLGIQQMQLLRIYSVPAIVINNKYKLDLKMVGGSEDRLFEVANYLVKKLLATDKKSPKAV